MPTLNIGDTIQGKIVKITQGKDRNVYVTLSFKDFSNATVKYNQEEQKKDIKEESLDEIEEIMDKEDEMPIKFRRQLV